MEVVRKLLDVRDSMITDSEQQLGVSVEARAIRTWEEFDEGIIRWAATIIQGAVIGEFSGAITTVNGAGDNFVAADRVPRGTVLTLDEIFNGSATSIDVRIGANVTGLVTDLAAEYTDARWGPRGALPPVRIKTGSNAVRTGDVIDLLINGTRVQRGGIFTCQALQLAEPLGNNQDVTIWGTTANLAISNVVLQGRVILPR